MKQMARKTNKTNHVLGLLAGKGEEVSTAEDKRQAAVNEAKSDTAAGSNVQVVAKQEEDEAIADTVKHLLEEELEAEDTDTVRTPEIIFDEDEEEALRAAEAEAREIFEEEERRAAEEAKKAEEEALKAAEEEKKAEENKKAEEEALKKAEEEALKAAEEKEKQVEKEYVFLNVMETLVRERVDTYMNQFATCQCSRCKADIIALALTSLPSKYVVVSRNAATPLMNFYSQRYAGVITVEITKACTKVKEHPHHGRD
jgi:hypothetical protein